MNTMKNLLKAIDLENIQGYKFCDSLSGGKASATLLYVSENKQKIVIKMLISPRNDLELEFFSNEAEALKSLSAIQDICFVPKLVLELSKSDRYPIYYFGTEFIEGETLRSKIESEPPPWPWEKCIDITHKISDALGGCLGRYVHRDLHPGNILFSNTAIFDKKEFYIDPGVRILDYGCCKDNIKFLYYGTLNEDKFRHIGALSSWSPEFIFNPEQVDS